MLPDMRPTRARSLFRLASWVAMVMLWTAPHAVSAFETDWTRIWTTNHDGDDPIEKELLTRLAHAKEESLDSESTFCSARYYKPLVHKSGYGNQILGLEPHLIAAKLMRRIYLMEPFHTIHGAVRGEQIPWAKMLDPTSAAAFVGTAVASDDFGRCASGGGGGGGGGRSLAAIGPKKMMQGGMGGGRGVMNNRAALGPKADLLFKYGTVPACSMFDGRFMQVWDRDEFLRQCSTVPHGVSANTWARAMWLISNGEATEPTAMAAFGLCAAVRAKEVVTFCPRNAVPTLDLPLAPRGIFATTSATSDAFGSSSSTGSLRSKFTNRSTPCLRHFLDPTEDDDNGANRDDHSRKGRKKNSAFPAGECNGEGNSHCAVATYCRMLRASTEGLGANLWTVKLGRWLVGELKTLAAHASAQAAQWHRERKIEVLREIDEDQQAESSRMQEKAARAEMAAKAAAVAAEANGINGGGVDYNQRRRILFGEQSSSGSGSGSSSSSRSASVTRSTNSSSSTTSGSRDQDINDDDDGGDDEVDEFNRDGDDVDSAPSSTNTRRRGRRSLLAKPSPPALPPPSNAPMPTKGRVLGLHLRFADCYTSADLDAKRRPCQNSKGWQPEHVPLIVRSVTRLISDSRVPTPTCLFVASNWVGLFKVFPRELWHAHGVTRAFAWQDLQGRVGGEFRDFNIVALEQEILRLSDAGLMVGLHSSLGLWTAQRRWKGVGDELLGYGDNKVAPYRPTRAVFALEELHSLEDEVARTSLALTGSPLDLFNDTVTNAVCLAGHGYPPGACPCVALRQEFMVASGRGFGSLPKNLYKAWGNLRCDAVLCEPLRPREQAAARNGEKFPCKRRFWDDVMRFPKAPASGSDGKKKKKKKRVQIK